MSEAYRRIADPDLWRVRALVTESQAWAAGSVFLLLQATLGLSIDAWRRRVTIVQPALPSWLDTLEIRGLRVRDGRVDLRIARGRHSAAIQVTERSGMVDVFVRK